MTPLITRRHQTFTELVDPAVSQYFEQVGLFEPPMNNKRKISSPSTVSTSFRASSASSRQFSPIPLIDGERMFKAVDVTESVDYIEIPVTLESLETLEFMGFCPEQARNIMNLWLTIPEEAEGPYSFFEFTMSFLIDPPDGFKDSFGPEDDWERSLDHLGVSKKLKEAILMPEFLDIRCTASCIFWVREAVEDNYYALLSLGEELKESAKYFKSMNFKGGEKKMVPRAGSISTAHIETGDHQQQYDGPTSPQKKPVHSNKSTLPKSSSTVKPTDTYTKLYRATSIERALRYYDEETGIASVEVFGSFPGDFSGITALAYWTPQKELADRYATWGKHKTPLNKLIITEVEVPEELVALLEPIHFWGIKNGKMDPDYQQFTFLSRRGTPKNLIPKNLNYIIKANLIISNILRHPNDYYGKMGGEGWQTIQESDLLKINIDGEWKLGIQWVFKSPMAQDLFDENCFGKVTQYNMFRLKTGEVIAQIRAKDDDVKPDSYTESSDLEALKGNKAREFEEAS